MLRFSFLTFLYLTDSIFFCGWNAFSFSFAFISQTLIRFGSRLPPEVQAHEINIFSHKVSIFSSENHFFLLFVFLPDKYYVC